MTNGVVLTAALRSNLLSLQQTQKDIDVHQNRLATGKKVNSALDNPQAFFAAQSLTDRANDLSNLLDAIGQSIQVINAANNGVSALTTLVNQAQSIANSAQSTLAGASTTAKTTGSVSLNGSTTWSTISGLSTGDSIKITVTDPTGGTNKIDSTSTVQTVTVATNDTVNDIITRINDLNTRDSLTTAAISASLDSSGHLVFEAVNGGTLSVQFTSNTNADINNLGVANALGYAGIAVVNKNGNGTTGDIIGFTASASSSLTTGALYSAANTLATSSTLLKDLKTSSGTAATNITSTNDTLKLVVGGKTSGNLLAYTNGTLVATPTTTTIQNLVDAINHDSNISSLVSASFDASTGKISLSPLTSSATDVQIQLGATAAGESISTVASAGGGLFFGTQALTTAAVGLAAQEDIRFGAAAGTLANLQTQYNTTLDQIDALVGDTGYAGTNLLNGNDLTTYFNETRTSSLTTSGVTFNSSGLGLDAGNFQSAASITTAINQTIAALTTVRNFGSTLSNNLSIIQNRQDFTNNLINTLKTGSDALTNADQNEEGASLLALQTRQSLGITSLSLASQAQQAILKLF